MWNDVSESAPRNDAFGAAKRDDRGRRVRGLAAPVERRVRQALRRLLVAAEDRVVVVRRRVGRERAGEVVPPVEVRADRLRVERRAVVEPDARAQLERPDASAVRRLPRPRELRLEGRRPGLQPDEALRDLVDHAQRHTVGDDGAVERRRLGRCAEDERVARRRVAAARGERRRGRRQGGDRHGEQHFQSLAHRPPSRILDPIPPSPGEAAAQYDRAAGKKFASGRAARRACRHAFRGRRTAGGAAVRPQPPPGALPCP